MAVFDITNKCNLKCVYCCRGEKLNSPFYKEPTIYEIKDTIKQLFEINSNFIVLQGGEPLIRSDVDEIINYVGDLRYAMNLPQSNPRQLMENLISENRVSEQFKSAYKRILLKIGLPILYISTNGMYYSEEILQALLRSSALLDISVDSFDEKINASTRVGADMKKINRNISLYARKLPVNISCTVTENNVSQLHLMAENAQKLGALSVKYSPAIMIGKREERDEFHEAYVEKLFEVIELANQKRLDLFLNIKVFNHQISTERGKELIERIKSSSNILLEIHECVACKCPKEIYIDPDLNVFGCASTKNIPEMAIGNLHQNTLNEVWGSSKRLEALEKLQQCYDIAREYSGCTAAALGDKV